MLPPDFAPYAPLSNLMAVIQRFRSMQLPGEMGPPALQAAAIPEGNYSRVWQALEFLGLIDDSKRPTEQFRRLVDAPDPLFTATLREVIEDAYRELLVFVNPETDDAQVIQNQFQRYSPKSQTRPMAALFLGLCREAGMDVASPARVSRTPETRRQPRRRQRAAGREATPAAPGGDEMATSQDVRLNKLVSGMLDELPRVDGAGTLSADELDRWIDDFRVILRRVYRVTPTPRGVA